jgi:protein-tyrosine phosphatase
MDYTEILPNLLVGSYPRKQEDIALLREGQGVTAVLNLQTDGDLAAFHVDWPALEQHYQSGGVELVRVCVEDFNSEDLTAKLPECVRELDRLLSAGRKVYLHCTAGASRSPTVAIAYLHRRRGWPLARALAYLKERRECSPDIEAISLAEWTPGHERSSPAAPPATEPAT